MSLKSASKTLSDLSVSGKYLIGGSSFKVKPFSLKKEMICVGPKEVSVGYRNFLCLKSSSSIKALTGKALVTFDLLPPVIKSFFPKRSFFSNNRKFI